MTMTLIEHAEVGSGGAASIVFTNIPQTYTDLVVLVSSRPENNTSQIARFKINGLTTNQSTRYLEGVGSGSAVSSTTPRVDWLDESSSFTASTFSNAMIHIPNYASTTTAKSISSDSVNENNATYAAQWIAASLWNSTSAITELEILAANNNLAQYSSATLYGITSGSSGGVTVS